MNLGRDPMTPLLVGSGVSGTGKDPTDVSIEPVAMQVTGAWCCWGTLRRVKNVSLRVTPARGGRAVAFILQLPSVIPWRLSWDCSFPGTSDQAQSKWALAARDSPLAKICRCWQSELGRHALKLQGSGDMSWAPVTCAIVSRNHTTSKGPSCWSTIICNTVFNSGCHIRKEPWNKECFSE